MQIKPAGSRIKPGLKRIIPGNCVRRCGQNLRAGFYLCVCVFILGLGLTSCEIELGTGRAP